MKKMLLGVLLVVGLAQGCAATLSTKDQNLVSTASAVGQGNLKKWGALSDEQKKIAMFNLVAASVLIDNHINGRAIPPEFQPFIDALVAAVNSASAGN